MTVLKSCGVSVPELLMVGGGAKSPFWRQMFADTFNMKVIKTSVDQNAASLGAAALAAYGLGYWNNYTPIDKAHRLENVSEPNKELTDLYRRHYDVSRYIAEWLAETGDKLTYGV
jgi:xylulokinase